MLTVKVVLITFIVNIFVFLFLVTQNNCLLDLPIAKNLY